MLDSLSDGILISIVVAICITQSNGNRLNCDPSPFL